jgi:hypothetical protein
MSERPCCRCPLCRIEAELLTDFLDYDHQENCRRILSSAPELAAFSGAGPLLAHLRLCRQTSSSDRILRALLKAKGILGNGIVDRLFLLAFLPVMHGSLRSVARRHPQLSQEDAAQQVLQSLLRFLDSEQLRARQTYLAFTIARRVKRAAFEWAQHEMRSPVFEPEGCVNGNFSANSFERLVLLQHFLDRAVRRGVLNEEELDLLIQFKLENGRRDHVSEGSSNAHRQRLKRLLSKLRRLAASHG